MKGVMFNIDNGYLEGLCRGFKNGKKSRAFGPKGTKQLQYFFVDKFYLAIFRGTQPE